MSLINDKGIQLTVDLTMLTNNGTIKWERELSTKRAPSCDEENFGFFYICRNDGDLFRLREFNLTFYIEDQRCSSVGIALEIIDEEGRVLWRVPNNPALQYLFNRVQEKSANVDAVLERVSRLTKAVA
ncbi:hypothetical protein CCP1ISM_9390001 [Azospirillaceae bacterium]